MFSSIDSLKPSPLKSGKYVYCGDGIVSLFIHPSKRGGKSKVKGVACMTVGYLQAVFVLITEAETLSLFSARWDPKIWTIPWLCCSKIYEIYVG